jgi:putative hydrolase of the HAD superfamily
MLAEAVRVTNEAGPTSGVAPLINPLTPDRPVRAVLFDLDGTLYDQSRMRRRMALELARFACVHPLRARSVWPALAAYRRAQEKVRREAAPDAAARQFTVASQRCGISVGGLAPIVEEWMIARPLKHLAACRAEGLDALLTFLDGRGVKLGVLSDYPALRKLEALGIAGRFSLVLSAGDSEVGVFKPHPRGFLAACKRWGLRPEEVLCVGDRADVDAAGAAAAGMASVIVQAGWAGEAGVAGNSLTVSSLERLHRVLDDDHR